MWCRFEIKYSPTSRSKRNDVQVRQPLKSARANHKSCDARSSSKSPSPEKPRLSKVTTQNRFGPEGLRPWRSRPVGGHGGPDVIHASLAAMSSRPSLAAFRSAVAAPPVRPRKRFPPAVQAGDSGGARKCPTLAIRILLTPAAGRHPRAQFELGRIYAPIAGTIQRLLSGIPVCRAKLDDPAGCRRGGETRRHVREKRDPGIRG